MSGELENVKAGDYVAERGGWGGINVHKVDRVTATQIITGDKKWSKTRGRLIGASSSSYSVPHVYPATEDDFIEVRVRRAQNHIGQLKVCAANLEAAETLIKVTAETGKTKP